MRTQNQEYSLADLLEHPALGLAIGRDGFDGRSLSRMLEIERGGCQLRAETRSASLRRVDRSTARQFTIS